MNDNDLTSSAAVYVTELFEKYQQPELIYHNLTHTIAVVTRTNEIVSNCQLDESDRFIVTAAAWFHDCGHMFGPAIEHEARSIIIMREYFTPLVKDNRVIERIEKCILATMLPNDPHSLTEEIICDADSYHLGTNEFPHINELVKEEFKLRNGYTPDDWDIRTLQLLENHTYFTPYCIKLLGKGKESNIELVIKYIGKDHKTDMNSKNT